MDVAEDAERLLRSPGSHAIAVIARDRNNRLAANNTAWQSRNQNKTNICIGCAFTQHLLYGIAGEDGSKGKRPTRRAR
jgi:hypothetical protein